MELLAIICNYSVKKSNFTENYQCIRDFSPYKEQPITLFKIYRMLHLKDEFLWFKMTFIKIVTYICFPLYLLRYGC